MLKIVNYFYHGCGITARDFLGEIDQKILAYFVRACIILTSWELRKNELDEAFIKLFEMNKLIERKYGQEKISPNLHLCLHICECALDYGPLSSFWCFSFERMNGILGIQSTLYKCTPLGTKHK